MISRVENISQPQFYNQNKIWTKPFIIAVIVVIILGIISLFTGVYDIRGQEDGMEMFFITRVPRTVALMLTGARWQWQGSSCNLLHRIVLLNLLQRGLLNGQA